MHQNDFYYVTKLFFDLLYLAIEDCSYRVAREGVQGLRGGLLNVGEVLLPQPVLVFLAEPAEVHLNAGLVVLLGRVVWPRRQEDVAFLGQGVLKVTDPLEVRCHVVIVVFHLRHLEAVLFSSGECYELTQCLTRL